VETGDEHFPPTAQMPTEVEERSQPIDLYGSKEQINKEGETGIQPYPLPLFRQETRPIFGELVRGAEREDIEKVFEEPFSLNHDEGFSDIKSTSLVSNLDIPTKSTEETGNQLYLPVSEELEEKAGKETILNDLKTHPDEEKTEGSQFNPSLSRESIQSVEVISGKDREVVLEEKAEGKGEETAKGKEPPPFPWIEDFRDAVETFYQKLHDIFLIWFEEYRKEGEFKNSLHTLLTILVHSRFDQRDQSIKALENTKRVFRLMTHPNLFLEDIPPLEGTPFLSGDVWRDLFHRAIPKIQQIGNAILERRKWTALDLGQIIQVIPHMGHQNSRKAIQWINRLIPDVVEVDLSDAFISVGESLYRVASRLGIVDPYFDYYQDRHSPGDVKIQSFARMAFRRNPMKSEEPMAGMGREGEQGGHCFTTQPQCEGCLFEAFCPRLYIHFDPSRKGMRE
jgi:hypothetical protein